jgi:hypothetical protein
MRDEGGGMRAEGNRLALFRFVIPVLAVTLLAGCDYFTTTSLKDVQAEPLKYEGKQITLKGTVADAKELPLIGIRSYTLQDGNAKIVIIAKAPLPAEKSTIKVKGTVKSTMIVNGKSVGQYMEEAERLK